MKDGYHWFQGVRPQDGHTGWYLYKMIRCGKRNCTKCPHGPYLYERLIISGRSKSKFIERYIGKGGSEKEQAVLSATLAVEAHLEESTPF